MQRSLLPNEFGSIPARVHEFFYLLSVVLVIINRRAQNKHNRSLSANSEPFRILSMGKLLIVLRIIGFIRIISGDAENNR